jgi:hypothetical protein
MFLACLLTKECVLDIVQRNGSPMSATSSCNGTQTVTKSAEATPYWTVVTVSTKSPVATRSHTRRTRHARTTPRPLATTGYTTVADSTAACTSRRVSCQNQWDSNLEIHCLIHTVYARHVRYLGCGRHFSYILQPESMDNLQRNGDKAHGWVGPTSVACGSVERDGLH